MGGKINNLIGQNDRIDMDWENQAIFRSKNSSIHRYGSNSPTTIPASGFWDATFKGLKEERARLHAHLHQGLQPQRKIGHSLVGHLTPKTPSLAKTIETKK